MKPKKQNPLLLAAVTLASFTLAVTPGTPAKNFLPLQVLSN